MKNFRQLVRETRVEDEGLPSGAALTLKDKPNKEPMQKLKEQDDTTEKEEMAQTQLHFIKYASEEIIEFIEMGGEIEEWYQNKLSKVHSDMEGLHSYIEGEKRRTGMVKEEEIDEGIGSSLAAGVGQFIGNKIDPMHGEILRTHGAVAGRMAEYHIRKGLHKIHKALQKHLSTGNAQHYSESVEIDEKITVVPAGTPNTGIRKIKLPGGGTITAGTHAVRPNKPKPSFLDQMRAKKNYTREEVEQIDEEEYDSVPASKALQKAHDDERKRRGLPDPSYYLELMKKKRQEIEDMKKEEVEQIDEISAETAKRVAQARDKSAANYKLTPTQSRRLKMKDSGGDPDMNAAKALKSAMKRGAKNVYGEEVKQPTGDLKDACWKGYTAVGMKMKNGRKVPNCVPVKEGYHKSQEIERQETERLKPPFTPDKPKKQAIAGKQGSGYSTARHLARQAMKKYTKPVKESLEESRRSEIIKEIVKKKKNEEKFNAEPIISDTVTKND